MFCPKCGAQNADNSVFCAKCGNALQTTVQQQQPVQQTAPMQQPVPTQQPVQQPYGVPQPPYYAMPAKQPMSKGVLATIICSVVVIVALAVVLLVVLLGDNDSSKKNVNEDDPITTKATRKTGDTEPPETTKKTSRTEETEPRTNAPVGYRDCEDVADALVDVLEDGDIDRLFEILPDDVIDYIVDDYGYSSAREWKAEMEENFEDVLAEGYIAECGIDFYSAAEYEIYEQIVEFYDEEFQLDVTDAVVLHTYEQYSAYDNGEYETEDYTEEYYLIEIDGVWYLEGIELFT